MIKSFRSEVLADLWTGRRSKVDVRLTERILVRLDRLDAATKPEEMNLPGWDFHRLRPYPTGRYTVHVNDPWCITFEFDGPHACRVDLEQYH
jgi:proteic killer suppression protein